MNHKKCTKGRGGPWLMAGLALMLLWSTRAQALPIFARRYGFECSMCHTVAPQLNRFGWEFQEAGYRLPSEIGTYPAQPDEKASVTRIPNDSDTAANESGTAQGGTPTAQSAPAVSKALKASDGDENVPPFDLGNYMDARYSVSDKVDSNYNATKGGVHAGTTTNTLSTGSVTLNVLTGGFNKYYGSFSEINLNAENLASSSDIGILFLTGVYGNENGFAHLRVGYFGGAFGYGAADRACGQKLSESMSIQTPVSNFKGSGVGLNGVNDADAIDIGYYLRMTGTNVTVRWNPGGYWESPVDGTGTYKPKAGSLATFTEADPASVVGNFTGNLVKNTSDDPGLNPTAGNTGEEFYEVTQFVTDEDAVSATYVNGEVAAMDPYSASTPFYGLLDNYSRAAAYANAWLLPETVNLLGGVGYAQDMPNEFGVKVGNVQYQFHPLSAWGAFGNLDWHVYDYLDLYVAYQYVQPDNSAFFDVKQVSYIGADWMLIPGINGGTLVTCSLAHTDTEAGPNAKNTQCLGVTSDNTLSGSFEYIW